MADIEDLPSDSDSSDDDYVPGLEGECVSEEEGSGEDEGAVGVQNDGSPIKKIKGKRKRQKADPTTSRKRTGGIKLEGDEEEAVADNTIDDEAKRQKELEEQIAEEKKAKKELDEKTKSDDLWASFLSDVGPRTGLKAKSSVERSSVSIKEPETTATSQSSSGPTKKSSETVKITKEFDFAGETVRITKEVAADSKEAKKQEKKEESKEVKPATGAAAVISGAKRPGGGLGNLLGKINKKPKMSTLEKSKLDWQSFKEDEGIEEELEIHNRGKAGFIERQAFLQRTDQRQFEKERDIRLGLSSKR